MSKGVNNGTREASQGTSRQERGPSRPSFLLELPWEPLRDPEDFTLVLSNLSWIPESARICAASSGGGAAGFATHVSMLRCPRPEAARVPLSPVARSPVPGPAGDVRHVAWWGGVRCLVYPGGVPPWVHQHRTTPHPATGRTAPPVRSPENGPLGSAGR